MPKNIGWIVFLLLVVALYLITEFTEWLDAYVLKQRVDMEVGPGALVLTIAFALWIVYWAARGLGWKGFKAKRNSRTEERDLRS